MDPRVETALLVAATCGLITAGLVWYGSGWKLKGWAVFFGLLIAGVIYLLGYAYLFSGTK